MEASSFYFLFKFFVERGFTIDFAFNILGFEQVLRNERGSFLYMLCNGGNVHEGLCNMYSYQLTSLKKLHTLMVLALTSDHQTLKGRVFVLVPHIFSKTFQFLTGRQTVVLSYLLLCVPNSYTIEILRYTIVPLCHIPFPVYNILTSELQILKGRLIFSHPVKYGSFSLNEGIDRLLLCHKHNLLAAF